MPATAPKRRQRLRRSWRRTRRLSPRGRVVRLDGHPAPRPRHPGRGARHRRCGGRAALPEPRHHRLDGMRSGPPCRLARAALRARPETTGASGTRDLPWVFRAERCRARPRLPCRRSRGVCRHLRPVRRSDPRLLLVDPARPGRGGGRDAGHVRARLATPGPSPRPVQAAAVAVRDRPSRSRAAGQGTEPADPHRGLGTVRRRTRPGRGPHDPGRRQGDRVGGGGRAVDPGSVLSTCTCARASTATSSPMPSAPRLRTTRSRTASAIRSSVRSAHCSSPGSGRRLRRAAANARALGRSLPPLWRRARRAARRRLRPVLGTTTFLASPLALLAAAPLVPVRSSPQPRARSSSGPARSRSTEPRTPSRSPSAGATRPSGVSSPRRWCVHVGTDRGGGRRGRGAGDRRRRRELRLAPGRGFRHRDRRDPGEHSRDQGDADLIGAGLRPERSTTTTRPRRAA